MSGGLLSEIQGRRAGVVTRGIAFAIDFFVVLAAFPVVMWSVGLAIGLLNFEAPEYPELAAWMVTTIQAGIIFLYFVGPWCITGRTLGQAFLGVRVVGRTKRRVNLVQACVRWLVLFLTLFIIGPVWLALSGKRLALHDRASRTQVIYDREPRRANVHVVSAPGTMEGPDKEPSNA